MEVDLRVTENRHTSKLFNDKYSLLGKAPKRSALGGYISETGAGRNIRKIAGNRAESHVSKDIRTKSLVRELRVQEGYKV